MVICKRVLKYKVTKFVKKLEISLYCCVKLVSVVKLMFLKIVFASTCVSVATSMVSERKWAWFISLSFRLKKESVYSKTLGLALTNNRDEPNLSRLDWLSSAMLVCVVMNYGIWMNQVHSNRLKMWYVGNKKQFSNSRGLAITTLSFLHVWRGNVTIVF